MRISLVVHLLSNFVVQKLCTIINNKITARRVLAISTAYLTVGLSRKKDQNVLVISPMKLGRC